MSVCVNSVHGVLCRTLRPRFLRSEFARAAMPCQLCGTWVDTSCSDQSWQDHGRIAQPWSLWPTGGSYYQDAVGHRWTVAHVQCQRALRLFALMEDLHTFNADVSPVIEELLGQVSFLHEKLQLVLTTNDSEVRACLQGMETQLVCLCDQIYAMDSLVRSVHDPRTPSTWPGLERQRRRPRPRAKGGGRDCEGQRPQQGQGQIQRAKSWRPQTV